MIINLDCVFILLIKKKIIVNKQIKNINEEF